MDAEFTQRFDHLETLIDKLAISTASKFDAIDARFDAIDKRFDAVDARFDGVDGRLESLARRMDDEVEARHVLGERVKKLEHVS
jgi:hypothetical protein